MDEITASPDSKRALDLEIFTQIAREYDFMTKFLSLGLDASWKRRLVDTVFENYASAVAVDSKEDDWHDDAVLMCVDLACGTGEITHLVATRASQYAHDANKAVYVKGIDLTPEMIEVAKHNYPTYEYPAISFQVGDMNNLAMNGLKDNSVDILTGGYAIRNAPDLRVALREIHPILKPRVGVAAFLDFSRSSSPLYSNVGYYALKIWGGFWGLLRHGKPWVYGYIADSLEQFPDRESLTQVLHEEGLEIVHRDLHLLLGLCETIHLKKNVAEEEATTTTMEEVMDSMEDKVADTLEEDIEALEQATETMEDAMEEVADMTMEEATPTESETIDIGATNSTKAV